MWAGWGEHTCTSHFVPLFCVPDKHFLRDEVNKHNQNEHVNIGAQSTRGGERGAE
jgi:hypothetical protein